MVDYLGQKASDQASQIHNNTVCDVCEVTPV